MFALRQFRTACLTTLALFALAPTRSVQGQLAVTDSAIRAILKTRVDSGAAMGLVVGIYDHGQKRYISYGSAGAGRLPLDEHTIFEIGSISKTFTALLLADAVTRNEVRFDQPVVDLLPSGTVVPMRDNRRITLEQLATHQSGLPRLPNNFAPAHPSDPYVDYGTAKLYAFLATHQLGRAPGDSAEYSNLGSGLLGHALTLRSGASSWAALVDSRIAKPLGMHETFVDVPASLTAHLSNGHDDEMYEVPAWHWDALAGAGALRSSAADMLTYLAAEMDTSTGPLARAVALGRAVRTMLPMGVRIALGWMVGGPIAHPVWWHNGGTGGFRSFAAFDPARQVAVVVMANAAIPADDIGLHVMNPAIPIGLPFRRPHQMATIPHATLDRLVGEYPLGPSYALTVTRDGDVLYAQTTGQPRFALLPVSDNHFVIPAVNLELIFDTSEVGPAKHVSLRQNGGMVTGARGSVSSPIASASATGPAQVSAP